MRWQKKIVAAYETKHLAGICLASILSVSKKKLR